MDKTGSTAGTYTLNDILEELRKPGRDPRDKFVAPTFDEQVRAYRLQPGMVLEGVVTNVTKFGAFVDIGVHQDGLVHISELANRYIKDASRRCEGGPDRQSEGLDRRCQDQAHRAVDEASQEPAKRPPKPQAQPQPKSKASAKPSPKPKAPPKPQLTFEEQVAILAAKWKGR